ncbi:hypothetical protein GH714_033726 [Hevea brasiliensis]|uniref:Uncharacterized protein n=1 Tax=Hevea brasiliensis TaxID=3981 RepID=A0A6A6NCD3_HEVBR|nr:hypothetical protein GH714_033726 [Hevea brasiliensis]
MMEDMKSQDFVQKFTVIMQELEQRQEVLRKEAEQRHQEALEEIKALLTGISFRNMNIVNNMTQEFKKRSIEFFLSGLVDELQLAVKMFKPRTLSEAYSLATLQEVTVATIKNNVNPDTKPTIFVTASFPHSTPSNLQSNFPKLSGSGDKFDLLPIPIIQLPKLPGVPPRNPKLEHHEISKVRRVSMEVPFLNLLRNYENCVEFDLSDHDYITLKEDEFKRWKRQRKKFYGRVDLLYELRAQFPAFLEDKESEGGSIDTRICQLKLLKLSGQVPCFTWV